MNPLSLSSAPYTFGDFNTTPMVAGTSPTASVPIDTAPQASGGGLSTFFGGFLSKAAETALDVGGALVKANNMPGSIYPTGQTNPQQLIAQQQANAAAQAATTKQYLMIGAGVAALLIVVLLVAKK